MAAPWVKFLIAATVGSASVATVTAVAQDDRDAVDPRQVALARELFEQGMRAAERREWDQARCAFSRAYALVERPRILLNLGTAQAETGQLVEAAESYRGFLNAAPGESPQLRTAAERRIRWLDKRTPRLRIRVERAEGPFRVDLDGRPLHEASLGQWLPVNPGTHEVRLFRSGQVAALRKLSVREQGRQDVVFNASTDPLWADAQQESRATASGFQRWVQSPWLWVAVGAVAAAGATGIALTLHDDDPARGNFGEGRWVIH